jgi:hypothetical protein
MFLQLEPILLMQRVAKFPNIEGIDLAEIFNPNSLIALSQDFAVTEQYMHEMEVEYHQLKHEKQEYKIMSDRKRQKSQQAKQPSPQPPADQQRKRQQRETERKRRLSTAQKLARPIALPVDLEPHFDPERVQVRDFNKVLKIAFAAFRASTRVPQDVNSSKWELVSRKKGSGLSVWQDRSEDTSRLRPQAVSSSFWIKAKQNFDADVVEVSRSILVTCLRKLGSELTLLDQIDPFTNVWHLVVRPPAPLFKIGVKASKARDFCFVTRKKVLPDKTYVFVATSIRYGGCPPTKAYVRGKIRFLGYAVKGISPQSSGNKYCQVTHIANLDILGSASGNTVAFFQESLVRGLTNLAGKFNQM